MPTTTQTTTDSGTPESEIVPGETLITIVGSGSYYLVVGRKNRGAWEAHEISLWALGEGQTIQEAADPSGVRYVCTGDIASVQHVDPTNPIE